VTIGCQHNVRTREPCRLRIESCVLFGKSVGIRHNATSRVVGMTWLYLRAPSPYFVHAALVCLSSMKLDFFLLLHYAHICMDLCSGPTWQVLADDCIQYQYFIETTQDVMVQLRVILHNNPW
jgi:hypothetical protein